MSAGGMAFSSGGPEAQGTPISPSADPSLSPCLCQSPVPGSGTPAQLSRFARASHCSLGPAGAPKGRGSRPLLPPPHKGGQPSAPHKQPRTPEGRGCSSLVRVSLKAAAAPATFTWEGGGPGGASGPVLPPLAGFSALVSWQGGLPAQCADRVVVGRAGTQPRWLGPSGLRCPHLPNGEPATGVAWESMRGCRSSA